MSDEFEPQHQKPRLSGAVKEWLIHFLPLGLKAFAPWFQAELQGVRNGRVFFLVIALALVAGTVKVDSVVRVSPLNEKCAASEHAKQQAEQKLAPFWAAGDRYFSNAPSAERLSALLDGLTN